MMNPQMMQMLQQLLQSLGVDPSALGNLGGMGSPLNAGAQPQQPPMMQPGMPSGMPPMTGMGAATQAPKPPSPMPSSPHSAFGQSMSQWAQSKPEKPAGFDGAWGQSSQMGGWKQSRPTKPGGM